MLNRHGNTMTPAGTRYGPTCVGLVVMLLCMQAEVAGT